MFGWVLNTLVQSTFKIREMWTFFLTRALKTAFFIEILSMFSEQ